MQNAEVRVEATLRPPRGYPEAIWWPTGRHPEATLRLYSDNYFWGLATIINSRKSHLSFLTQPQLKLS
jgi:hypothetical protein